VSPSCWACMWALAVSGWPGAAGGLVGLPGQSHSLCLPRRGAWLGRAGQGRRRAWLCRGECPGLSGLAITCVVARVAGVLLSEGASAPFSYLGLHGWSLQVAYVLCIVSPPPPPGTTCASISSTGTFASRGLCREGVCLDLCANVTCGEPYRCWQWNCNASTGTCGEPIARPNGEPVVLGVHVGADCGAHWPGLGWAISGPLCRRVLLPPTGGLGSTHSLPQGPDARRSSERHAPGMAAVVCSGLGTCVGRLLWHGGLPGLLLGWLLGWECFP
jgi:hypothetical protein